MATAQGHFQQLDPLKSRPALGIPTEAVVPSRRLARSFPAPARSHTVAPDPLLVDHKFSAGRPPFGNKFFFGQLPVVAFVATDAQRKLIAADTIHEPVLRSAKVAAEAQACRCIGSSPGLYCYERAAPSVLHVTNSGPAGHGKILWHLKRSNLAVALAIHLKRRVRPQSRMSPFALRFFIRSDSS